MHPSRPFRPGKPGQGGFTLIEVMISLFVLAVMAGMAWQGVDMVVRSRDAAKGRTEAILRVQSVVGQWEADLRAMVASEVVPGFEAQGNVLRLTRQADKGLQVVSWTVRGGSLYRWASAPFVTADALQEAWMSSYQLLGNEPGTLRALSGVAGMQLYTFSTQSNAWSNAQSTGDLVDRGAAAAAAAVAAGASTPAAAAAQIDVGQAALQKLPDGVRLLLSFAADAPAPTPAAPGTAPVTGGSGTIVRTLRLVHP